MICAVPAIDPIQLFGGGGTEGGITSATGCPNRVMSTRVLVRRTLSRTARHVALNSEMAMLSMRDLLIATYHGQGLWSNLLLPFRTADRRLIYRAGGEGPPGVEPRRVPIRTRVMGGFTDGARRGRADLGVETVVVVVVVVHQALAGAPVRPEYAVDPGICVKHRLERVLGGVVDLHCIAGANHEEVGIARNQYDAKPRLQTRLFDQLAVVVFGSMQRIAGVCHVVAQHRGVKASFIPVSRLEGVGHLQAVLADLPGQHAVARNSARSVLLLRL